MRFPIAFAASLTLATLSTLSAQTPAAAPPAPATTPTTAASRELTALGKLPWRSLGPTNNAGRVSVVAGVAGDPSTYFVSGANEGAEKG